MFLPSTITLKPGDSGDFVSELQRRLSAIGLFDNGAISGIYDEPTTSAVRDFQSSHGLQVDGVAGPETIRRLNGAVSGSSDNTSSGNNEEEKKEAEKNTLKDSIITTMAAAPALDPALMEDARQEQAQPETTAPAVDNSAAVAQEREALAQREAQEKAAEAAQAKIDQQSQMTEMLMKAAQNKQTGQQTDKMPPKELVESEALAQREQQAAQKEAIQPQQQTQQPTPQELAAQKEQIAQQSSQQQQVAEKPPTMLQKLKDYVESKLPTETVKEVVQTGTKMLKAGVQQASMPDDGAPQRAPETGQAKGQEQTAQIG